MESRAPQKVMQYPKTLCFLMIFCCNPANCLIANECTCTTISLDAVIVCQWQPYNGICSLGFIIAWCHLELYQAVTECRQAGSGKVHKSQILAPNSFSLIFILNIQMATFPPVIRKSFSHLPEIQCKCLVEIWFLKASTDPNGVQNPYYGLGERKLDIALAFSLSVKFPVVSASLRR